MKARIRLPKQLFGVAIAVLMLVSNFSSVRADDPADTAPATLSEGSQPAEASAPSPVVTESDGSDELYVGLAIDEPSVAPGDERGEEIIERRTDQSKTFAGSEVGRFVTDVYAAPVHFRDAVTGDLRDIDTTLQSASGGRLRPRATAVNVDVAAWSDDSELGRLVLEPGVSAAFSLVSARRSEAVRSADTALYRDALADADLELSTTSSGLKEVIVLKSRQAPDRFLFRLDLEGLTPSLKDGGIEYRDRSGRVRLRTPRGWMQDSNIDPHVGEGVMSGGVTYRLVTYAGEPALAVTLDRAFLDDPKRVYPIRVDPTNSYNADTDDTFVQNTFPNNDYSGHPEIKAGTFNGGTDKVRSYIHFVGINALDGKVINSADLRLFNHHSYSCTATPVRVFRMQDGWAGATTNWNNQHWVGGQIGEGTFAHGYSASCPDAWENINITTAVRNWADNTWQNHGVNIRAANESDSLQWKKFHSRSDVDGWPKIQIDWSEPNLPPATPSGLSPNNGDISNTALNTLKATYNDPDAGDTGRLYFRVYDQGGVLRASYDSNYHVPGTQITYSPTLPDGLYTWKVQAFDGALSSAWTSRTYRIDSTPPPMPDIVTSSSHRRGFPDPDRAISMKWTWSTDSSSGLSGYSWTFNNSETQAADAVKDGTGRNVTSAPLSDGSWWFHVRAIDNAGNGSTDVAEGPLVIDGDAINLPYVPVQDDGDEECEPGPYEYDAATCDAPPDPLGEPVEGIDDYRSVYGYSGPYYSPLTPGQGIRVLEETVYASESSDWKAWGLVRNETTVDVGTVNVTASLFDPNGLPLGQATAIVPVSPLRRNEPAPFSIQSTVPGSLVGDVDWAVTATPATGSTRKISLGTWWTMPYGNRDLHTSYIYADPVGPPLPYRVAGSVTNEDTSSLSNPMAVAAWMDDSGRIRWVQSAPAVNPDGSPAASLTPGTSGDFEVVVTDPTGGPLASSGHLMLWGSRQ